jgi:hypothetical protein
VWLAIEVTQQHRGENFIKSGLTPIIVDDLLVKYQKLLKGSKK